MKPFDGQQGRGHNGTFKQAADSVPWRRTSGRVVAHASSACAQRGAKAQPEKLWLIGGGVPGIVGSGPSIGRSMRGVQASRPRVSGWAGAANRPAAGPCSTERKSDGAGKGVSVRGD